MQAPSYLEYKRNDNSFLAEFGYLAGDETGDAENQVRHDNEKPCKNLKQRYNLNSKRSEIPVTEAWIVLTRDTYPNQRKNPSYVFIQDDEIRTSIRFYAEVRPGSNYYKSNPGHFLTF